MQKSAMQVRECCCFDEKKCSIEVTAERNSAVKFLTKDKAGVFYFHESRPMRDPQPVIDP